MDVKATEVSLKVKQAYWGRSPRGASGTSSSRCATRWTGRPCAEQLIDSGLHHRGRRLPAADGEGASCRRTSTWRRRTSSWPVRPWVSGPASRRGSPSSRPPRPCRPSFAPCPVEAIEDARTKRPEFTHLRGHPGPPAPRRSSSGRSATRSSSGSIGQVAYATNRDNPFVYDPLNDYAVGPVVASSTTSTSASPPARSRKPSGGVQAGRTPGLRAGWDPAPGPRGVQRRGGGPRQRPGLRRGAPERTEVAGGLVELRSRGSATPASCRTPSSATPGRAASTSSPSTTTSTSRQLAHAAGLDVEEANRIAPDTLATGRAGGKR